MRILPSGNFITPPIVKVYQDTLTMLRNDLGRFITVVLQPRVSGCPNCEWDSISRKSSNRYNHDNTYPSGAYNQEFVDGQKCPVCYGNGRLNIPQSGVYKAMIRWRGADYERPNIYGGGGQEGNIFNADVRVKISISGEGDLQKCEGAWIDGVYCILTQQPTHRGLGEPFIAEAYFNRKE